MDIFDYIRWRGDLTFFQAPPTSVDALILCQLSYLNFTGIVEDNFSSKITLNEAAAIFVRDNFKDRKELGLLINPKTVELLFACAKSKRFANLKLCGFSNTLNQTEEEQFSAITFISKEKKSCFAFCAFRGTDDTIIGWKEDFNLAYKESVKAQIDAHLYLENAIKSLHKIQIYCGGHSKGGNLAIYAGAKLCKKAKKRLKRIYNFDGPGFLREVLNQRDFFLALGKTKSYFPRESIVGMLFEHDPRYFIVESRGKNIQQHDPFTWETEAKDFLLAQELEKSSVFFNTVFNDWYFKMTEEKRKEFVEVVFAAISSTQAKTNSELAENWGKTGLKILKSFSKFDREMRDSALDTAIQFLKLAGHALPDFLRKKEYE
ncbi:Mbeg1-like protein [Treponema pectinovorum]|uniref:Mbeg1-like protein n=1 Tax=Treponema pectinovorum TaxID=164 RepID=UPI0011F3AA81|nr:Mbeg1-like protein [Treponema pectinovorum]